MEYWLNFIINSGEEHAVLAEWNEKILHRNKRLPGSNEVVKDNDVAMRRNIVRREHRSHTVLWGSESAVLEERQTELLGNANGNERGEVAHLVATLRRSHHRIVIGREKRAENRAYKRHNVVGKVSSAVFTIGSP